METFSTPLLCDAFPEAHHANIPADVYLSVHGGKNVAKIKYVLNQ